MLRMSIRRRPPQFSFKRWSGAIALFLGALLLVAWWVPDETRVGFVLSDAAVVAGQRRTVQLELPARNAAWKLLWRHPDHKLDRCVVSLSCGASRWESRASTIPGIETTSGAIRLGDAGLLNFSLPEQGASCDVAEVAWENPPRAWVGPTCVALLLGGLAWTLRRTPARQAWVVAVLACSLGTALSARLITDAPMVDDASQNFAMAWNVANHGVYSMEARPPLKPTNYREPIPNLTAAASIALAKLTRSENNALGSPGRSDLAAAKFSNLVWVFVGLLSAWLLTWVVSGSHAAALCATFLAWVLFYTQPLNVDSLLSETHAAALITSASAAFALTIITRRWSWALAFGSIVGLLCLTKATFLYISAAIWIGVGGVAVLMALFRRPIDWAVTLRLAATAAFAMVLVCVPWMARNKYHFDRWSIAQRGGVVLMVRATKNQMTHEEWAASWWLWGPQLYRDLVAGTSLGCTTSDFNVGGPYERLSRADSNKAVSYYHAGREERATAVAQARRAGYVSATEIADREVQRKALSMIHADPLAHLKCTLPFAWRGIWCIELASRFLPDMATQTRQYAAAITAGMLWLSLASLALVSAVRRSAWLFAAVVLPVSMLAFHALLTHNIPRYSDPVIPVMCVTLVVIVWFGAMRLRSRLWGASDPSRVVARHVGGSAA